ncbi:MAG: hypothetical protein JSW07_06850, partial [bacterium]
MISKKYFKVLLLSCFCTLFLLLLFTCAAKKPFWGDEKTGFILNYRLSPNQVWKYSSTSSQMTDMEQMGQTIETETNSMTLYTVTGKGLDNKKNLLATTTIDTMSVVSKGMGRENKFDLMPLIGKSFGLTFSPKGEELEFSGADTLEVDFGMMGGGKRDAKSLFRSIFPDLPEKSVKIGETWTDNDTMTVPQGGMEINIKTESSHTVAA